MTTETRSGTNTTHQAFDENEGFTIVDKRFLGKRVPINTVTVSQSPINKMEIFFAFMSKKYS